MILLEVIVDAVNFGMPLILEVVYSEPSSCSSSAGCNAGVFRIVHCWTVIGDFFWVVPAQQLFLVHRRIFPALY